MYENAVAGIVSIIGVAIVLGVGTTVLGSQNTAFDCTTVLGYSPATSTSTTTTTGLGKNITKAASREGITANVIHDPINEGDTGSVIITLFDRDGDIITNYLGTLTITKDGVTVYTDSRTGFVGTSPGFFGSPHSHIRTFSEGPGQYKYTLSITGNGPIIVIYDRPSVLTFTVLVGERTTTTTDTPASYTSWAKTCQDVNEQNRQAWLLVPVILIVIAAGVILFFLRHGFS